MVKQCLVIDCNNLALPGNGSFFRIRLSKNNKNVEDCLLIDKREKAWEKALKWKYPLTESDKNDGRVCSRHFVAGRPANFTDVHNVDWVPNQCMGYSSPKNAVKRKSDEERETRCAKRAKKRDTKVVLAARRTQDSVTFSVASTSIETKETEEDDVQQIQPPDNVGSSGSRQKSFEDCCTEISMKRLVDGSSQTEHQPILVDASCQVNLGDNELALTIKLQTTQQELEKKLDELKVEKVKNKELLDKLVELKFNINAAEAKLLKVNLDQESFVSNDKKTKYFTGLCHHKLLFILHEIIAPHLSSHFNTRLCTFKQLLLTLMKLRLNLPFEYLAYRFDVSPQTASDYFYKCIHVMSVKLKNLVYWPDRDELHETMPECFKENYGNKVTGILDCFEIFTESPSNLHTGATYFSHYKHHKTAKVLLVITPQGSVSLKSDAWGGRTSDKHITENSDLCERLIPGDLLLADRGFLIMDFVQSFAADLNIPAFTKGKTQLDPIELETTRNIARVRIHVERVIGCLRQKFLILCGTLQQDMLARRHNGRAVIDEILEVCCALYNLNPSIVPLK